jgi:hypothetical protein
MNYEIQKKGGKEEEAEKAEKKGNYEKMFPADCADFRRPIFEYLLFHIQPFNHLQTT